MNRRDLAHTLGRILDERRDRERDVLPRRVVARNADGTESRVRIDGTCPERGEGAHELGEVVTLPTTSHGPRGGTGSGIITLGEADLVWVERQEPRELVAGATQDVVIHGRGLVGGMSFEYLRQVEPDQNPEGITANPGVTVDQATCIDAERYELTLTVAPGAAVLSDGPIAYTAGGRRRRRDDFYGVVSATSRNFHVFIGGYPSTMLRLAEYRDGNYVADVGTSRNVYPRSDIYPIYGDPLVPDGAVVWIQGPPKIPRIQVWNWYTAYAYKWNLPEGWAGNGAVYVDGYLWFILYLIDGTSALQTRLYRATADLSTVDLRASYTAVGPAIGEWLAESPADYPALYGPGACGIMVPFVDANTEVITEYLISYTIPGGVGSTPDLCGGLPVEPRPLGLTIPLAGRGIYLGIDEGGAIGQWDGDATVEPWWPESWDPALDDAPVWTPTLDGIGRSPDSETVYIYNSHLGRVVIGPEDPKPGSVPEAVIDMEPHPQVSGGVRTRVWPAPEES